jgi:hypothetical protein
LISSSGSSFTRFMGEKHFRIPGLFHTSSFA